jgi:peptide deformylase
LANILKLTYFGNPSLRKPVRNLSAKEIMSAEIQDLIADMRHTVDVKKYGVGLAAPQIGQAIALSIVSIKQTPSRPNTVNVEMVIINPKIVKTYGRRSQMWEGCISFGGGGLNFPYAKALRWSRVRVRYFDEKSKRHEKDFGGLLAHVLQHEIDHLHGILFVDRVKDSRTYAMVSEYKKYLMTKNVKRLVKSKKEKTS